MPTPIEQLLSRTLYNTDGTTTEWDFYFADGYIYPTHVKAYTTNPAGLRTEIVVSSGMLIGPFQLRITPALPSGDVLTIYRDTPKDKPLVDFTDKSGFSELSLDTNARQAVMVAAEAIDVVNTSTVQDSVEAVEAALVAALAAAGSATGSASQASTSAFYAEGYMQAAADSAALAAVKAAEAAASAAVIDLSAPGPIGGGTPNTGAFTALSATGALTTAGIKEDAAGNLGIGVTPSAWGSAFKVLDIGGNSMVAGLYVSLASNAYNNGTGWVYKSNNLATRYDSNFNAAGINAWFTAPSGTAGDPISFTQAMTLDAGGNLLLGHTVYSTGDRNGVLFGASGQTIVTHATDSESGGYYHAMVYGGGIIGSITQAGTTAVAYNTTSDHRLKENVRDADAARFMDIKFRDFEWIDGRHDCGVIAHELQQVYPDLVLGEKDATEVRTVEITPAAPAVLDEEGNETAAAIQAVTEERTYPIYQQVNYQGLIGRMGTRVQALQRAVDAQAALIEAMEARLTALESV